MQEKGTEKSKRKRLRSMPASPKERKRKETKKFKLKTILIKFNTSVDIRAI